MSALCHALLWTSGWEGGQVSALTGLSVSNILSYQKLVSVSYFPSSFKGEFAFTCPTFWYWLVPASPESEEVGCHHRRNLPSQEPGQGHFLCPRATPPAGTAREHTRETTDELRSRDRDIPALPAGCYRVIVLTSGEKNYYLPVYSS